MRVRFSLAISNRAVMVPYVLSVITVMLAAGLLSSCQRKENTKLAMASALDRKAFEIAKSACEPGEEPELMKETEWRYTFKTGKSRLQVSKFSLDRNFKVEASAVRKRWPMMDEDERIDFASNFWVKETWDENDTEILEIIMQDANDRVWQNCALAFLHHPDRDRAMGFLIDRMQSYGEDVDPLNYIQALGIAKDRRATALIKPYYEKYRKALEVEATIGVPEDVVFGPIPYHHYFAAAAALWKIEGSLQYEEALRKYFDHPHEQVRYWAEHALEIEGPTTAKRNAENIKKRAKR